MLFGLIGALAPSIIKIIDKLVPDKAQAAKMKLELLKLQHEGNLKQIETEMTIAVEQSKINAISAASAWFFDRGWRPFIGWICGLGLAYQVLARPFLQFFVQLAGLDIDLISLDLGTLMPLMFGMLGLGAYRTYEKVKFNRRLIFDQIRREQGGLDQQQVDLIDKALDEVERK